METLTLDLPAMYGDHHVVDVRRILLEMPGVSDVYASSAFRTVELTFDPAQVDAEIITGRLDDAGYMGDLLVPEETGKPSTENGKSAYFRHTQAYAEVGNTVSFAQDVSYSGRPLWPCPGVGPLQMVEGESDNG